MKRNFTQILFCILLALIIFPVSAQADMGPKPSVQVDFSGMGNEAFYVTLLSKTNSSGPATTYDGNPEYADYHEADEDYAIWEKFVNYSDSDGYYFLQQFEKCQGNDHYSWDYYPPSSFKILLYFPESDAFAVSDIHEEYAFDSYFTVSMDSSNMKLTVRKNYPFQWELVSLTVRMLLTILIEALTALLFHFRAKKQLQVIICTNILTQIVLNILLSVAVHILRSLVLAFFCYIFGELLVFIIEAVIYVRLLPKYSRHKPIHPVLYALTANILSFSAGMWIVQIIPGIF